MKKVSKQIHEFDLLDLSPGPLMAAFSALMVTFEGVLYMHGYFGGDLWRYGFIKKFKSKLSSLFNKFVYYTFLGTSFSNVSISNCDLEKSTGKFINSSLPVETVGDIVSNDPQGFYLSLFFFFASTVVCLTITSSIGAQVLPPVSFLGVVCKGVNGLFWTSKKIETDDRMPNLLSQLPDIAIIDPPLRNAAEAAAGTAVGVVGRAFMEVIEKFLRHSSEATINALGDLISSLYSKKSSGKCVNTSSPEVIEEIVSNSNQDYYISLALFVALVIISLTIAANSGGLPPSPFPSPPPSPPVFFSGSSLPDPEMTDNVFRFVEDITRGVG